MCNRVLQLASPTEAAAADSEAGSAEEVEETEIAGFVSDEQALLCANVAFRQILQVFLLY